MTARRLTFAISADYERRTGGWIYDQRLLAELERRGWAIDRLTLPAGFPDPDAAARLRSAELVRALPDRSILMIDQLCLGVMPELAAAEGRRLRLVMIVHHPLGLEGDRPPEAAEPLIASEREALRHVTLALTTSQTTARTLADQLHVSGSRVVVAPPGIDPQPLSTGNGTPPLRLLAVGAVVPRKGHRQLIEALGSLVDRPWQLQIVGNLTRAAAHVAELRSRIAASAWRAGSSSRASWRGRPSRGHGARPISSSRPRGSKVSGWPWPRRSRAACRW